MNKKANELDYPLTEVKKVIHKWLYLEDDRMVDVINGIYIANQLKTDPLWAIMIGPPSSAKTEILRALGADPFIEFISSFTKATLVSGMLPKGKMPEPSLLYKLDGKILVIKEFSSILSMRKDDQAEVLAQLREAYDGSYKKAYGTGKVVDWKGQFGLLAASTPAYDRHYGVVGSLGDRFLLYRNHNSDKIKMGMKAMKFCGQESTMRKELEEAFSKYLAQFHSLGNVNLKIDEEMDRKMVSLAVFCSFGRCNVERDRYNQTIEYIPEPEGPPRLAKQFKALSVGIALAYEKTEIDEDIYDIIKKVGCDLIQSRRFVVLKYLWENQHIEFLKSWVTTQDVSVGVGLPGSSTRLILEDIQIVGLLNRELSSGEEDIDQDGKKGRKSYKWQINDEGFECITGGNVFESKRDLENAPF